MENNITLDYEAIFNYKAIKAELQRNGRKCRHFTKAFLQIFAKAKQDIQSNDAKGINMQYFCREFNGWTRREYDAIRQTAFYRVESGSYCEFLQIAHSIEQQAREKAEREKEGTAA